jgi:protocatechuate 3,4-dioxygenase beta subunit
MILLSDVLGISALVDAINNPTAPKATESSVLGPFHNHAHEFENGQSIASKGAIGEPMLVRGTVSDTEGKPLSGVAVDVWETNGNGFYDMQDPEKDEPDCRGIFHTDAEGRWALVGVRAVDYPIPFDGPVGVLLRLLNRSNIRPAHVVCSQFISPKINRHRFADDGKSTLCSSTLIAFD